jgi:hypothetical protein
MTKIVTALSQVLLLLWEGDRSGTTVASQYSRTCGTADQEGSMHV